MKSLASLLLTFVGMLSPALPAVAQNMDFNLTYHVERTPKSKLSIETCGSVVAKTARQTGLAADMENFPNQLVVVRGGSEGRGAYVVQCIEVESTTVIVVQGIDYRGQKASMGQFADKAHAALKAEAD